MQPTALYPCLYKQLFPQKTIARDLLLILGGSLVVALLAQLRVPLPFTPVPITGQTLGVTLVGATLGPRLGFLALLAYLVEGVVGAPVFAGGTAGIASILGPTGGYLIAYPISAALVGFLVERVGCDRQFFKMYGAMVLSSLVIFGLGTAWLGMWLTQAGRYAGLADLMMKAVIPFIPGDLIKSCISASLFPTVWRFLNRQ